jgi:L-threonylcarbamoyladenylate synthase
MRFDAAEAPDAPAIQSAAAALRCAEVVALTTETYFALAADATQAVAVDQVLALKGRAAERTLALLVEPGMVDTLCLNVSFRARALMAAHWPGPLTLVLPARPGLVPAIVQDGFVAMRVPSDPLARAVVAALGRPLTATSANRAGESPARTAEEVRRTFPGVRVVGQGPTPGGPPSTLARVDGDRVEILRQGALVLEEQDG